MVRVVKIIESIRDVITTPQIVHELPIKPAFLVFPEDFPELKKQYEINLTLLKGTDLSTYSKGQWVGVWWDVNEEKKKYNNSNV